MTNPYAVGTADRPGAEHPAPATRPRSAPSWTWLVAGVLPAAVVLSVVLTLRVDGSGPVDGQAIGSVAVDGQHPVELDGETVTTPCFSYRVPVGLELDGQSTGCSTAVGFGRDDYSRIQARVQRGGGGTVDEIVAELRPAFSTLGDPEFEAVTVAGRDAVRIRAVDAWGVRHTSYIVPLPAGRFTQAGADLDSIWLTSPASPDFDRWMATVLDSLEIPGD